MRDRQHWDGGQEPDKRVMNFVMNYLFIHKMTWKWPYQITTAVDTGTSVISIWAMNMQAHEMNTAGPSDFIADAIGQTKRETASEIPKLSHPWNISGSDTILKPAKRLEFCLYFKI